MFAYFQHESGKGLEKEDFMRFSREFSQIICENVPTVQNVSFVLSPQKLPAITTKEDTKLCEDREAQEQAVDTGMPVFVDTLLLVPFSIGEDWIIAKLHGLDALLVRKIASEWLDGLCALLLREFLLVKRACVDPLTGLLSSLHLEEYLNEERHEQQSALLLVSLYPKGSSIFLAKKYQYKVVSLLNTFVDKRFPLFYLGQSCFAIVCKKCDATFLTDFIPALVNFLKRERCYRVHIGSTEIGKEMNSELSVAESVMKNAWAALHVASKRGPFAFCSHESIANAANHPFAPPLPDLSKWLLKHARGLEIFSLLQVESVHIKLTDVLSSAAENGQVIVSEKSSYLFLPGERNVAARKIGKRIQKAMTEIGELKGKNIGISSYPLSDFRKSEMLLNCRKALRHAEFLEAGAIVTFDAVSLNISGDVYYGEGDLVRAVKEYKRGLVLDPLNGNLLNSLGVCYAQMNRRRDAVDCFEKACTSAENQFAALFNLGMEQQFRDEKGEAICSFDRALALAVQGQDEENAREDMRFQLAVLCTEEGHYEKALKLFLSWSEFKKGGLAGKKAARYLGECYYGLGRYKEAMTWLQRGMRYDEFDADVLGLLGEIYLQENEGDDIGLRFCEKSVELSPDSLQLKIRLAKAQTHCGDFQAAVKTLQPCLRNKKTRAGALLQRGLLSLEKGHPAAAEKWFLKIIMYAESSGTIKTAARHHLEKMKQ